jgi:putative DNA primase/helicase
MTWFVDVIQVAPLAIITAPEKRCGKSLLLSTLGRLVRRAIEASNISPSALFRSIEKWQPTLLIDEADSFMKDNEELRGILNSGHTRAGSFVIRSVGDDHVPTRFSTWGCKVISGIGQPSVPI